MMTASSRPVARWRMRYWPSQRQVSPSKILPGVCFSISHTVLLEPFLCITWLGIGVGLVQGLTFTLSLSLPLTMFLCITSVRVGVGAGEGLG